MLEVSVLKREIIKMNKELCKGCGVYVQACHEGAIRMEVPYKELVIGIEGKVKK